MHTPPIWLGDAVGGLVSAAVLGLPAVALKRSFPWWLRWVAGVVWFAVVGTILYFSLQDVQIPFPLVPPVLFWKLTLWKVLAVVLGLAAIGYWGTGRRWLAIARDRNATGADTASDADTWAGLEENERQLLGSFLEWPNLKVPGTAVGEAQKKFGVAHWNRVTLSLREKALLSSTPTGGIRPSPAGSRLLLWASRGPLRVPDPPPPRAPVTWSQLTDTEKEFLKKMWNTAGAFISYVDALAYQEKWGPAIWNTTIERIDRAKLIKPSMIPGEDVSNGWTLSNEGRELMISVTLNETKQG